MSFRSHLLRALTALAVVSAPVLMASPPEAAAATTMTGPQRTFFNSILGYAQSAQRSYGTPASVLLAVAIKESNWGTSQVATKANNYFDAPCGMSLTASGFAKTADAQVGKPYVLGAETSPTDANPPKFDCSELVEWLYARSGNRIVDLAASQYAVTKPFTGSPKAGDLVFLRNNPARYNGIGHVAVLTEKMSNGDWRIIEARGRAWGVVRSTLSYWKSRSYYAGVRRYPSLMLAGQGGVVLSSTAYKYQVGCLTVTAASGKTTKYRKYRSMADSFADYARALDNEPTLLNSTSNGSTTDAYIGAASELTSGGSASTYAAELQSLIDKYRLSAYDVVSFKTVLTAGATGPRVSALQYLLRGAGTSVPVTGTYDDATVAAIRAFQRANGLTVDGDAGPEVFGKLAATTGASSNTNRISAANTLLVNLGYSIDTPSSYGAQTQSAVRDFQNKAGLTVSGNVDRNTWAKLFQVVDPAPLQVTGAATVGSTVTATTGAWGPGTVALSYRWYRGSAAIAGATRASYQTQPADAGARLSVSVTGSRAGYLSVTRTATVDVAKARLTSTPTPTIAGTAQVGSTLSATAGAWTPAPVTLAYQWNRGGQAIAGATAATYVLQAADLGRPVTVTVTGTRDGYVSTSRTSTPTDVVSPGKLTAAPKPTIGGTAQVGQPLTATPGTWAPAPVTLAYQWYRGTAKIAGATSATYVAGPVDRGATLTVKVTGSSAGYASQTQSSAATAAVKAGVFSAPKPTIVGTAQVGKVLTAKAGSWSPKASKLTYQWYRGATKIVGATAATYTAKAVDKGKALTVRVTGTKAGYVTKTVASAATAAVKA